jgi:hypothetical protein
MFRMKGWVARYKNMDATALRAEIRRIGRAQFVFEREEKLAYLENRYRNQQFRGISDADFAKPNAVQKIARLRSHGFRENEPINLDDLMFGGVA